MARSVVSVARALGLATLFLVFRGAPDAQATSVAQDCDGGRFLVSAVAVTGLAVFDIVTAPASARRYNQRHLVVAPFVDTRHHSYGFSASLSFGRPTPTPQQFVRSSSAIAGDSAPARKSPGGAFVLSFGSTTVPMAVGAAAGGGGGWVFLGGLVVGPSVGHFYSGQVGRGLGTVALRGAGTAIGLYSLVSCFD
jgi:hypothetical protein